MIDGGVPKLIEHRRSYWKTAASTAALSLAGFAVIVWLVFERQTAQRPWPALVILAWWAAASAPVWRDGDSSRIVGRAYQPASR